MKIYCAICTSSLYAKYNLYSCICVFTAGLGEFKLRDLNDEINKLLREKGHWDDQIKVLGGPDYKVSISLILTVRCFTKKYLCTRKMH